MTTKSGIHLGLEAMTKLLAHLPSIDIPYIHIAGTNGKGSVSAMIDSCLIASGIRTGRFNSPHLVTTRDSMLIDGKELSAETYAECRERVMAEIEKNGLSNSEFEITTATAFLAFATAEPPLDVLVIECGMGGLRDATNALSKDKQLCAVLTAVDLDHQGFLGATVRDIGADKLGIVKEKGIVVVGRQEYGQQIMQLLEKKKAELGCEVFAAGAAKILETGHLGDKASGEADLTGLEGQTEHIGFDLPLHGPHQAENLSTALTTLSMLRQHPAILAIQPKLRNITTQHIRSGISSVVWKGRCSWLDISVTLQNRHVHSLKVLVDGAHNSGAALQLRRYIDSIPEIGSKRLTYIVGLSQSPPKTARDVLEPLLTANSQRHRGYQVPIRVIPALFSMPVEGMPWIRPVPPEEIANVCQELGVQVMRTGEGSPAPSLSEALHMVAESAERGNSLENQVVVVTGSLYLVADAYRLIQSS